MFCLLNKRERRGLKGIVVMLSMITNRRHFFKILMLGIQKGLFRNKFLAGILLIFMKSPFTCCEISNLLPIPYLYTNSYKFNIK